MAFDNNMDMDNDLEPQDSPPKEESGNRTFLVAAGILGAITVLALICIAVYALVLLPRQQATREQQVLALNAQNTEVALALLKVCVAAPTLLQRCQTIRRPRGYISGSCGTNTPAGPDPRTATVAALLTQAAQTTQTVVVPTATNLPDTGFADEVGIPVMMGMAVLLVAVIFIARRLRSA